MFWHLIAPLKHRVHDRLNAFIDHYEYAWREYPALRNWVKWLDERINVRFPGCDTREWK